jgi:outer membrane protein assembly factor BamA
LNPGKAAIYSLLYALLLLAVTGCSPTRLLNENQFLLQSNRIICKNPAIDRDEINKIIKQKPNRRILRLIRFHLGVYNYTSFGKERKWKRWLKRTVGEEPVVLDNELTKRSSKQIQLYLFKKGYFNAIVKDSTYYKYKKAKVIYTLIPKEPYRFGKLIYIIPDAGVSSYVFGDRSGNLIKEGDKYDEDVLEKERERITKYLRNNGYFDFLKEYIHYEGDSALGNHTVNITMEIQDPQKDSLHPLDHHYQYTINNVYINLYNSAKLPLTDSLTALPAEYIFRYHRKMPLKASTITGPVFFFRKELFKEKDIEDTYRGLAELRNFKNLNIDFKKVNSDSIQKQLDTYITLVPSPKLTLGASVDGTHNSGDFGIGGSVSYQNKNSFRGAEIFEVRLKGALEVQHLGTGTGTENQLGIIPTFNTIQLGPEVSLSIPKFFFPFIRPSFSKRANPKTKFTASYNFQQRPDYQRSIVNMSMFYSYKETDTRQHIIYPIDINLVGVTLSPAFADALTATNNALIIESYKPLLITAVKYSFIYSNQEFTTKKRYSYFRINTEFAGNGVNAIVNANHNAEPGADGYYTLFNIRYSQYAKGDIDYRFYKKFSGQRVLVNRVAMGLGKAYGNAEVLPFVKSFYAGGTNDIRAWTSRSLGPGAYGGSGLGYERIGDIKLEYNIEYRYNVYKMLNAATFIDAGNIWLAKKDSLRPNAEFNSGTFYKQIAIGAGFGLRYDFSFFIIRLDAALPVYDPTQIKGSEVVIMRSQLKDINFNLGIGYPF